MVSDIPPMTSYILVPPTILSYLVKRISSASSLLGVISARFEVVGASLWFEQREDVADSIP